MKRVLNRVTTILEEVIALYKEEKYEQAYQLMMNHNDILNEVVLPDKEKSIFCYVMQYITLYKEKEQFNYHLFFENLDHILAQESSLLTRMKKDLPKGIYYFIQQWVQQMGIQKVEGQRTFMMIVKRNIEAFYSLKNALLFFLKESKYRKELYECVHNTMIMIDKEIIEQSIQGLNENIVLYKDGDYTDNDFLKRFIFSNDICFEVYHDLMETRYYSNEDFAWIARHLQLVYHIFSILKQHKGELSQEVSYVLSKQRRTFNRLLLSFTQLYWEKYYREYRYLQNELEMMENKLQSLFVLKHKKDKISKAMTDLLLVKENPIIYCQNKNYQLLIQKYSK